MTLSYKELISQEYEEYINEMRDACHFPTLWSDKFYDFKDLLEEISSEHYDEIETLIDGLRLEEFDYESLGKIHNQIKQMYS